MRLEASLAGVADESALLSRDERRKEAIVLLTETLPEVEALELAGMRGYQKARLARIYMEDGERDWAVSLLEQIREDPQLDQQQFEVAEALVEDKKWKKKVTGRMQTRTEPGYLAIESEGRFELRVGWRGPEGERTLSEAGALRAWYNLEDDPFKTTNLVRSAGALIGFSLIPMAELPVGRIAVDLVEDNATRVRFRCQHLEWPFETLDYTVYPTGQIYLGMRLELEGNNSEARIETVLFRSERNDEVNSRERLGEGYLLSASSEVPSPQHALPDDFLLVTAQRRSPSPGQSVLRIACEERGERQGLALHARVFPRSIDSPAEAEAYAGDYQSPATLRVREGGIVRDDKGDLDRDGFNESEGCYVVKESKSVTLVAGGKKRHGPAIKFVAPKIEGLPEIQVNGERIERAAYNLAWVGTDTLILHWHGEIPAGEELAIELK